MKKYLSLACISALLTLSAQAELLYYEGFQNGYSNPTTGAKVWDGSSLQYNSAAGALGFGPLKTTPGASGGPYSELKHKLESPIAINQTTYISFLMLYDSYAGEMKDSMQVLIFNGLVDVNSLAIGYTHSKASAPTNGISIQSGPPAYTGAYKVAPLTEKKPTFQVVKLEPVMGDIKATLYVFDDPASLPTDFPTGEAGIGHGTFNMGTTSSAFQIKEITLSNFGVTGTFDEIRIGTSYADVVPR